MTTFEDFFNENLRFCFTIKAYYWLVKLYFHKLTGTFLEIFFQDTWCSSAGKAQCFFQRMARCTNLILITTSAVSHEMQLKDPMVN